jgi:hypothetical protein
MRLPTRCPAIFRKIKILTKWKNKETCFDPNCYTHGQPELCNGDPQRFKMRLPTRCPATFRKIKVSSKWKKAKICYVVKS